MATKSASKSKKKANKKRFVGTASGAMYEIIREDEWGYWCDGTQFSKYHPNIVIVEKAIEEPIEEEPIEESEEE